MERSWLKSEEEILTTLRMQVERGEGDALTHLDGCLIAVWLFWRKFGGCRRERKGRQKVGSSGRFNQAASRAGGLRSARRQISKPTPRADWLRWPGSPKWNV